MPTKHTNIIEATAVVATFGSAASMLTNAFITYSNAPYGLLCHALVGGSTGVGVMLGGAIGSAVGGAVGVAVGGVANAVAGSAVRSAQAFARVAITAGTTTGLLGGAAYGGYEGFNTSSTWLAEEIRMNKLNKALHSSFPSTPQIKPSAK